MELAAAALSLIAAVLSWHRLYTHTREVRASDDQWRAPWQTACAAARRRLRRIKHRAMTIVRRLRGRPTRTITGRIDTNLDDDTADARGYHGPPSIDYRVEVLEHRVDTLDARVAALGIDVRAVIDDRYRSAVVLALAPSWVDVIEAVIVSALTAVAFGALAT